MNEQAPRMVIQFSGKLYIPVKYGIPRVGEDYIGLNGMITQLLSVAQAGNLASVGPSGPVRLIVREIDKPSKPSKKLTKALAE